MGMGFQNPMNAQSNPGVMFPGMMGGPMDMSMGGGAFNPYMMPFAAPAWYPGTGSAAAFHQ